ncbi:MAG: uncharacterized membrane protein YgdD (TMEM256/DUF423 family) [Cyclobacteriaceae bacterium]|jgi:uncharacterized membrane protein YgdD (TMEM256/DUF423 family)
MNKKILLSGSIFGLLTVVIGAFGAHALEEILLQNGRVDTFETAVKYQGLHALALVLLGIVSEKLNSSLIRYAAISMVIGILIFSGSLYILSITNIGFLGAITPIGGLGLIAGWILLIIGIYKPSTTH